MNNGKLLKVFLNVILLNCILTYSFAQKSSPVWNDISKIEPEKISARSTMPDSYRSIRIDLNELKLQLSSAIDEADRGAFTTGPVIELPLPDGSSSRFRVALTTTMHENLASMFPMIRTFSARGIDDPSAVAKLDYTQWGFHAMIMSSSGWYFIDPAFLGNTENYICYDKRYSRPMSTFICETENLVYGQRPNSPVVNIPDASSGTVLKTYRLALACTGEYAAFYGGTISGAMSGMVTSVNRVNGVYELEVAVRMVLIANDNLLVFTNASTDPYTNNDGGTMLGENQSTITSIIGNSNYDFGHVVSTGGGGVAYLGVICNSSAKAGGVTGSSAPIGDGFDIDYVAHEMGHQFGGNHTFNSVTSSCNGNRAASAAYEPGSGTTIMAYAGICGADDLQPHSDAIFHSKSYDEIQTHITSGSGSTCPVTSSTGNTPPTVNAGSNYTIPISTPFILAGSGADANGDAITYLWEEYDLGPAGSPGSPSGNAPIFRDFVPTTSPSRTFPKIENIVRNTSTIGEILPSYARSLAFRLTVRDNRNGGGGVVHNDTPVSLTVTNTTTPFRVTSPNTAVSWFNNSSQTVTWDVSSTNLAPISCANVNILLSIDSGYTFPYTLLSSTPNDGSEVVTIPNVISTKARIKVESVGNIFFDMSNVNFTIQSSSPVLTLISTSPVAPLNFCAGSPVSVSFTIDGPANAGNVFTAQLSNSSGSFASPVNIGTLTSVNAGTINATIPAGASAGSGYRIRVVSSNPVVTGSDNGSNISIFLIPATAGSITGSSTVCQGQTGVIYSVSAIANATSYNWTLPAGAIITAGANTSQITVSINLATTGLITVAGVNNGCSGISSNKLMTINALPAASGNISGTTSVCQNQTNVPYSVAAIAGASGYSWTLPSGATINSGSNTNSITVNFSSSALSGPIKVSGTNACGAGTVSNSFPVSVSPAPAQPSISANGSVNICNSGSVTLSFTPIAGVSYQWRKNSVNIPGQTGTSYVATTAGNYDVAATFTPAGPQTLSNINRSFIPDNTCTGGSTGITVSGYNGLVNSSLITIKINVTHTWVGDLVLMLQASDGSYLGLSNRTGNSNNNGDNFANTYFSDAGSTVIPTSGAPYTGTYKPVQSSFTDCVGPTITSFAAIGSGFINPNGNWNFAVFDRASQDTGSIWNWSLILPATVTNSCNSISNSINVTVTPTVTPSLTIAMTSGTNPQCAGTSTTFTATPTNGGSTPSYQWKRNTTSVGTNSPTYTTATLTNGQVVTCVLISNANCASPATATSNGITMTVNPPVTPSVSIGLTSGSNPQCSGASVTFTATPTNGGSNPSFQWKIDGNNAGTNSPTFSTSSLNNGETVTCEMTSDAECVISNPANSNPVTMIVNNTLIADVSIAASPGITICSGANVTFTATPANGGANPSYQWKNGSTNVGIDDPGYSTSSLTDGDVITCIMTSDAICVTGNPATSNSLIIDVNAPPSVSSFTPSSGIPGDLVTINGSGFTGATSVDFNGTSALFTIVNDNQVTATVPIAATTGMVSVTTLCGTDGSSINFVVSTPGPVQLSLRILIEGYIVGNGVMADVVSPSVCDTLDVSLAKASSPYNNEYTVRGTINNSGDGLFEFPESVFGNSFYIVINHRNTIETWSDLPVLFSSLTNSYDFTTSATKAFGNNQVNINGEFAIRSGDINQDGIIDETDLDLLASQSQLFQTGYYSEDLTGDNITESSDLSLIENNLLKVVARP